MKKTLILVLALFVVFSCDKKSDAKKEVQVKKTAKNQAKKEDAKKVLKLGKKLELKKLTSIKDIMAKPNDFLDKKVLVEGLVSKVCTRRGCWMIIVENENRIRIKVKDGVIVFPVDAIGKTARVEGVVYALKIPKKHNHEHKAGEKHDHEHKAGEKHNHEHKAGEKHDHEHKAGEKHNHEHKAGEKHDHKPGEDCEKNLKVDKKDIKNVEKDYKIIYQIRALGAEIKE